MEAAMHLTPGGFVINGVNYPRLCSPEKIKNVKTCPLTKDDLLLAGYIKSGTTWLQEILWLIMNDCSSYDTNILQRVQPLEYNFPGKSITDRVLPGPTIVKTHLHYSYFVKQVEQDHLPVVVIMRNIKDVLVSAYHFYRANAHLGSYTGTWTDFFEIFKAKGLVFGDYLDFNLGWWEQRHRNNIMIVFYEDLKQNPNKIIKQIDKFCDKNHSDDVIGNIAERVQFEVMRDNPYTNITFFPHVDQSISQFMRKGEIGDWKNYFTPEQSAFIEEHYESKLKSVGLNFQYEP